MVAEFGAGTAPDEIDAERFAAWFGGSGGSGPRPRGTSRWTPSARPRPTGSGRAGSPPTRRGCWPAASRGRTVSRALSRAEVEQLLTREDISLRERTLWRMLYETAARSAEVLALDVEDLDLPNRRARVRRKGGAVDVIVWQTGTARLLPRLLKGRTSGPVFVTERKARVQLPAADLDPSRPRPAQLPAGRGAVLRGLRRRDLAPAPALGAHPRRRGRHRHADADGPLGPHLGPVAGQVRAGVAPRRCRGTRPSATRRGAGRSPSSREALSPCVVRGRTSVSVIRPSQCQCTGQVGIQYRAVCSLAPESALWPSRKASGPR